MRLRKLSLDRIWIFYLTLLFVFGLMIAVFALTNPRFLALKNFLNVLRQAAPTLISAVGMTIVISMGGIDLSVGSVLAVIAVLSAMMCNSRFNPVLVVIAMIVLGFGIGTVNGLFVAYQRIPAFIVTLAAMSVYRGLALVLTRGYSLPIPPDNPFIVLGRGWILGVPVPVWIAAAVVLLGYALLYWTRFGVYATGIGSNEEAVRRAGVNVKMVKLWAFGINGALAAVAGIVLASRVGAGSSYIGVGFELTVIASVILGGTNLFGGEGRMLGTVLGTLMLAFIGNGLVMMHVSAFYQQIAEGIILLAAIWLNHRIRRFGGSSS